MAAALHLQRLTRRRAVLLGTAAGISTIAAHNVDPARAVLFIDLNRGNLQPMPIALPDFLSGSPSDGESAHGIPQIIAANLRGSGLFAPIDQVPLIERIDFDRQPSFAEWGAAQALVIGRVDGQPDGRIIAEFRLWDVAGKIQLDGQLYLSMPDNFRRIAHIISDRIYERLTGEKGYFDSRIVFVDEPKDRRIKRLAMMDQDGADVRYLTDDRDLVLSPRFSPSSQEITYMSLGQGEPRVYLLNTETQQREIVGNFPGMTFSPRFTPDGQRVIMSLRQGANASLFVMDLRSKATTRLTDIAAIDTAPCYSPDASRICFESDRGGHPQIYVMSARGGPPQQVTFGDGSYSTPVWSPRGDLIAFTNRRQRTFAIGVIGVDGKGERILTEGFHNEGPTFAPNGLVLMFFRDAGGNTGPSLHTIDITGRNEQRVPTPNYASDPAWSPLLA
jgi:TolB protein